MPRKPTKASGAAAPRSSSKRAAPPKQLPTRQSKRVKATPKKSQYFEPDSDDQNEEPPSPTSAATGEYGADSLDEPSDVDGGVSDEEEVKPKRTPKGQKPKKPVTPWRGKKAEEKELWRPGAELPSDTQVIIQKPKAREAGKIPYTDETIHPNTLLFLKDLAAHNDRKWFKSMYSLACMATACSGQPHALSNAKWAPF